MQDISFKTIEEFLDYLPPDELKITVVLRKIILDNIPNVTEYLSYNIPCYKVNRNICFIWPHSVKWGNNKSPDGVRFGFNYGYLLRDESDYLDKGKRKQVFWRDFTSLSERDISLVKSFLFEAVAIDAAFGKK
jgi:hypothetical protein